MNMYALEGDFVKVTSNSKDAGRASDQKLLEVHGIKWQKAYNVERTRVGSFSSTVELKEFPGIEFNTVNFEDVYAEDHSRDRRHPDWEKYNKK